MRVAIVSSWPPDRCGVADGVARLAEELAGLGVEVVPVSCARRDIVGLARAVRRTGAEVAHHEFPTMHHRHNLAPYLCPLLHGLPCVVTLHEFTRLEWRRKLQAIGPALHGQMVFPTRAEKEAAARWLPWAARRMHFIPVSSNVPTCAEPVARDPSRVAFFGLLGPGRGIEQFLALAELAKKGCAPLQLRLVGEEHQGEEAYGRRVQARARALDVEIVLNQPLRRVAQELAAAAFAYLPYPLGAAENRGTLLAALGNGCIPVTTRGNLTPSDLAPAVEFATNPVAALRAILDLQGAPPRQAALRAAGAAYASRFGWGAVAGGYADVYRAAARRQRGGWRT